MSDEPLSIDGVDNLIKKFSELTGKEQKKAKHTALRKASSILIKAARTNLSQVTKGARHPNRWNGKTMESGVKMGKLNDATDELKVHIMGDFRLKFFQSGTKRRTTKINANRGSIKKTNFFANAVNSKKAEAEKSIDTLFQESINRIWSKK